MKEQNELNPRPNGLLSVVLRLGCALLASAGIAAARTPAGAVDDAAARLRAPEQAVAPALEAAPERETELKAPGSPSVKPARRANPDAGRSTPAAAASRAPRVPSRASASAAPAPESASSASRRPGSASPRGPPASA